MRLTEEQLLKEITFKTSRSGGKGGQHVNKVDSKVEIIFNIQESNFLAAHEKALLVEKLGTKIDQLGNIHVISQEDRSQLHNKKDAIEKLILLITNCLHIPKKRKATKTPYSVIEKRLKEKLLLGNKKENRKRPPID
jgi:ribosome-associated protein